MLTTFKALSLGEFWYTAIAKQPDTELGSIKQDKQPEKSFPTIRVNNF